MERPEITITLDTETAYCSKTYSLRKSDNMLQYISDDRFMLMGMSFSVNGAGPTWYPLETGIEVLKNRVKDKKWAMAGQNVMFDAMVLIYHYGIQADFYYDTESMSRGMDAEASASLAAQCLRIFPNDPEMRKGQELQTVDGVFNPTPEQLKVIGGYCDNDVFLTQVLLNYYLRFYPEPELDIIDTTIKMYAIPKLVADKALLEEVIVEEDLKEEEAIKAGLNLVDDYLGGAYYNPDAKEAKKKKPIDKMVFSSNVRFVKLLKDVFNLDAPTKISPTTGKPAPALGKADVPYIQFIAKHGGLHKLWEARSIVKSNIAKKRAERMIEHRFPDGRFPVPLKYYGAKTGRYSGMEKVNCQNLQRNSKHRLALQSQKGQMVYVADLSNIEARTLAWLAGDEEKLQAFRDNRDVYCELAQRIYNKIVTKKENPTERGVGKVAELGLGYGMGWRTFKTTLGSGPMGMKPMFVEDEFAQIVVNTYRDVNFRVVNLWEEANQIIGAMSQHNTDVMWRDCLHVEHEKVTLPNGMVLSYPDLSYGMDGWTYQSARYGRKKIYGGLFVENINQALARLVISEHMTDIKREILTPIGGQIVLQVHDEVIAVAPHKKAKKTTDGGWEDNDFEEEIMNSMYGVMRTPPKWCPDLPLDAEGGYDFCYSK